MFQMCWALIDVIATILTQASATTVGPLHGSYVGLATAITPSGPDTLMSAVTEATYTGYARVALAAWGAQYRIGDSGQGQDSALADFQPSDAVAPNQINAVFIADAATAGNLQAFYLLPNPVPLTTALQHMPVIISAVVQAAWSLGAVQTW